MVFLVFKNRKMHFYCCCKKKHSISVLKVKELTPQNQILAMNTLKSFKLNFLIAGVVYSIAQKRQRQPVHCYRKIEKQCKLFSVLWIQLQYLNICIWINEMLWVNIAFSFGSQSLAYMLPPRRRTQFICLMTSQLWYGLKNGLSLCISSLVKTLTATALCLLMSVQ